MVWAETIAVTVFLLRPETSASWRIAAPARYATRIMSSRISDSSFGKDRAEDDAERMSYAPFEAYESLTGERLVRRWPSRATEPTGERTPEDQIMSRYQELLARPSRH
jgi:hypothetical protein